MRPFEEATAKCAAFLQEIEQNRMAAAPASSHTQETVTSETETQLVMVEGAVPDLDLLTLRQQALDAVAAAPEVRGLLLKLLNLPKAQQMVISGALNLHQPTVTPTPWTPTRGHGVEEEEDRLCRIATDGGCENYNGPHILGHNRARDYRNEGMVLCVEMPKMRSHGGD